MGLFTLITFDANPCRGRLPRLPTASDYETPKGQAQWPAPTNTLTGSRWHFRKSATAGGHSGPPLHGIFSCQHTTLLMYNVQTQPTRAIECLVDGLSTATKQKGEPFRFSLKSAGPEPQDPTHKGLPSKRRPAVGLAHTYKQNIYRR